jgi:IS1 family transposase
MALLMYLNNLGTRKCAFILGVSHQTISNWIIEHIYTDANSCYAVAFSRMGIPEPHTMTKAQTHLIESSNSSIRDNLARFNRKTKRYSKSLRTLTKTLDLFFAKHLLTPILQSAM